jgi:hypothetical protein
MSRVEVFGRVAMRGLIAAADMAAASTDAQMNPRAADLQTFLASFGAWLHLFDRAAVGTGCHAASFVARAASMV